MKLREEIERKVRFALAGFEERVRPLIEKETTAQYEEWKRNNPRSRVCYFCKRVHRRPHLLFVVDRRGEHRRWTSRACFEKRIGFPAGRGLLGDVWKLHV